MKIGIDLVEIDRVRRMLKRHGRRFEQRLFTPAEAKFCRSKLDPAVHFAGRIAAKEAVRKVVGGIGWKDVEILSDPTGAPRVHLRRKDLQDRLRNDGYKGVEVSITHTSTTAAAAAIPEPSSSRWL